MGIWQPRYIILAFPGGKTPYESHESADYHIYTSRVRDCYEHIQQRKYPPRAISPGALAKKITDIVSEMELNFTKIIAY